LAAEMMVAEMVVAEIAAAETVFAGNSGAYKYYDSFSNCC